MTFIKDQFLNMDQVCEILQIDRSQFYKLRKRGQFPPTVMIGYHPRWSLIELHGILKSKSNKE